MLAMTSQEQSELKKGPWAPEEDEKLKAYMETHGETGSWNSIPKAAGLNRNGKSCRMRWTNYLRPGIKRGNISKDEQDAIIRMHKALGPRWSRIAAELGRTENEIKNHFHTRLKKKVVPKDKVPPELHPDAFTWNPQLHGLGFSPTLPAHTLSSLPPFNYPAMEDPQYNNNHPQVHASLFSNNIIQNALVSELSMSNHQVEKEIAPAQEQIANPFFTSTTLELVQRADELILGDETNDSFYKELALALQ